LRLPLRYNSDLRAPSRRTTQKRKNQPTEMLPRSTLRQLIIVSNLFLAHLPTFQAAPANQVVTMTHLRINPDGSATDTGPKGSGGPGGGTNGKRKKKKNEQDEDEPEAPAINFTIDGMSASALKKRKPCYLEKSGPDLNLPTRVSLALEEFDSKDPEECLKKCARHSECNFGRYYDSIERCFLYFAKDANWECKVIHFEFMKNY